MLKNPSKPFIPHPDDLGFILVCLFVSMGRIISATAYAILHLREGGLSDLHNDNIIMLVILNNCYGGTS